MGEISFFAMIVMIVLIVTIGRVYRARYKALGDGPPGASAEEAARLRGEVTRLNERLQVLERLATDPQKRLADQIDALAHPAITSSTVQAPAVTLSKE